MREAMLLENYKYLTAEMRCDELFKRNAELKALLGREAVERELERSISREANEANEGGVVALVEKQESVSSSSSSS